MARSSSIGRDKADQTRFLACQFRFIMQSTVVSNPKYLRAVGMTKTASSSGCNEDRLVAAKHLVGRNRHHLSVGLLSLSRHSIPRAWRHCFCQGCTTFGNQIRGRLVDLIEMVDKERRRLLSDSKKISGRMAFHRQVICYGAVCTIYINDLNMCCIVYLGGKRLFTIKREYYFRSFQFHIRRLNFFL